MRRAYPIGLWIIICASFLNCKQKESLDCNLLMTCVTSEVFKKEFFVCKYPDEILTIIDSEGHFKNCSIESICDRKVILRSGKHERKDIRLHRVDRNKNEYVIYFMTEATGISVIFTLLDNEGRIEISDHKLGRF